MKEENRPTLSKENKRLVLEERYQALSLIDNANDALDDKAGQILQASSILVTLMGLFTIPGFVTGQPNNILIAVVVIAVVAFIIMIHQLILAFQPGAYPIPGPKQKGDTIDKAWRNAYDVVWNRYLLVGPDDTFKQILTNLLLTIERIRAINTEKAKKIKVATYLFLGQLIGFSSAIVVTLVNQVP